eukprot:TRINITY_DN1184_c0_g1_i5.p1 TRINITY_DN1184_c0_g1~~TRINITY_DN1184_c0_g1_i5.p1  ORF type:complete len:105 (+),score=7.85 TRINITY_DN1184_c0_g1_i5:160-474(+)
MKNREKKEKEKEKKEKKNNAAVGLTRLAFSYVEGAHSKKRKRKKRVCLTFLCTPCFEKRGKPAIVAFLSFLFAVSLLAIPAFPEQIYSNTRFTHSLELAFLLFF